MLWNKNDVLGTFQIFVNSLYVQYIQPIFSMLATPAANQNQCFFVDVDIGLRIHTADVYGQRPEEKITL